MAQQEQQTSRVLRRPKVQERTGLSKSGIYLAIQNGEFPAPSRLESGPLGGSNATSRLGYVSGSHGGLKRKLGTRHVESFPRGRSAR